MTTVKTPGSVTQWVTSLPQGVQDQFERIAGRWKEREVAGVAHQRYARLLINEFERRGLQAEGGARIYLPVREQGDPDWVVPDAFVVARTNPVPLGDGPYSGVPDLVVEVLAADNDHGEDGAKKAQYARAGVLHYWLVRLKYMTVVPQTLGDSGEYQPAPAAVALLPLDALPVPAGLLGAP